MNLTVLVDNNTILVGNSKLLNKYKIVLNFNQGCV